MRYVDGYLIPMPKKNIAAYRKIAQLAGKIWMEHGALEYRESAGEDLKIKGVKSFLTIDKQMKSTDTIVFAWVVYKSRAHRDKVNAKVMKDPRISTMIEKSKMPFDMKRMFFGGFDIMVDL